MEDVYLLDLTAICTMDTLSWVAPPVSCMNSASPSNGLRSACSPYWAAGKNAKTAHRAK